MNSAAITIRLRSSQGPADLSTFASVVSVLRISLENVWRCVAGDGAMDFVVTGLTETAIEAAPSLRRPRVGQEVVAIYQQTVTALQANTSIDPIIDFRTLRALEGFSAVANDSGHSLAIGPTVITHAFTKRITELLAADVESLGSVTGRLKGVMLDQPSRFILCPPIDGEQIECVFDPSRLPDVLKALDKNVTVFGLLRYSATKSFPTRVDVDSFELIPMPTELPSLLDSGGLLNHPLSSVEMIRETRNEWR